MQTLETMINSFKSKDYTLKGDEEKNGPPKHAPIVLGKRKHSADPEQKEHNKRTKKSDQPVATGTDQKPEGENKKQEEEKKLPIEP